MILCKIEPNIKYLWNTYYMKGAKLSVKYILLIEHPHLNRALNSMGVIRSSSAQFSILETYGDDLHVT